MPQMGTVVGIHGHTTDGLAIFSIFKRRFDAGGADTAFKMMLQDHQILP